MTREGKLLSLQIFGVLGLRPLKFAFFLMTAGPHVTERTPSVMSTLMHFEGGNALAPHQVQALLPKLQAINPKISGVHGRFVHWVAMDQALDHAALDKLAALLNYGDAYEGPADGDLIVVAPRLGTLSPWASKATDIAHNFILFFPP